MSTKCGDFPIPLPDDPKKWNGWTNYKSPNLYERLCLDPYANPSNELIEEHCRELLRWWQKKLPLKNQPSNPLAQMLRPGLDESSRYLTEARVELLDPERRRQMDEELAIQARAEVTEEFEKYLAFALLDGLLTPEEEKSLFRFAAVRGLGDAETLALIEAGLQEKGAKRPDPVEAAPVPEAVAVPEQRSQNPQEDFLRMLRLSGLDSIDMTDDQRDAFINMAENLGIDPGEAEDLVDRYLDEIDNVPIPETPKTPISVAAPVAKPVLAEPQEVAPVVKIDVAEERRRYSNFQNSLGGDMLFIPSGQYVMGSEAPDAAPNERPLTPVTVSRFCMSRHLITNAQYEEFDAGHVRKRAPGTDNRHPVIYVSNVEAVKFCQWLSGRERRKYRLPTEAEWEYAARGTDGRKYPWGNHDGRGDLANFADRNTVFAWSDREIDDGFSESSPVGAYPRGASPFGMEDMAGNVWEWCLDYFEAYRGTHKTNPRGGTGGTKRVYRGGSWKSRFNSLRATCRGSNLAGYSCNDLGFRVVCECE